MTRGVVIHAYNNEQIDYGLISLCNALYIKSNLEVPVCLITDQATMDQLSEKHDSKLIERAFDHVIFHDCDDKQTKRFQDTPNSSVVASWHNASRSDSYDLTPFDETLVIDADYFICDRSLRCVWGSSPDIMINRQIKLLNHGEVPSTEIWLAKTGIELYWATCIYFKKSEQAEVLFDLVRHIKFYYDYYSMVYGFPVHLYRNDYAFSIAVHMLNGFVSSDISLPSDFLLTSFDCDELVDVPAKDEFVFLVKGTDKSFTLSRTKNVSVHIMNKFSIVRMASKMLALYE